MATGQDHSRDWTAVIDGFAEHGRHVEPYAGTTQSSIDHMRKRWQSFCVEAALADPEEALQNVQAAQLKAFFQWMIENAERTPPQIGTLKQYFRILKMIYKRDTGGMLDEDVVCDVNAFIQYYAEGKKETSHRPKPVPSGEDLVNMLHFLYSRDKTTYPDERQRVQQGFLMIIHASSGLRPSSVTQSNKGRRKMETDKTAGVVEEVVKLRYRDMALLVGEDEQGRPRFAVEAIFTYFKGGNRRPQRKTFTWTDQADILTCPVAHLVALALHDKAFKLPSLHDAGRVFSLTVPSGAKRITIPWRDDILDTPILRGRGDGTRAAQLQDSVSAKRLKYLGEQMGYPQTVTWYWLRRLVLNAVDGFGSEEVRNQVAGHLDSRTYRNNYQDQRIGLDVASLVRGQKTEDALLRKFNDVGVNADPNANIALPGEAHDYIATLSDVAALQAEQSRLAECIKTKYGSIKNAPTSEELVAEYVQAKNSHRARKEFHKMRIVSQLRKDFFARKDAELIEAQLNGGEAYHIARMEQKVPVLAIPERAELANLIGAEDMRCPSMRAQRGAAVQVMADLCCRVELKRKPVQYTHSPSKDSSEEPVPTTAGERIPMKCQRLQCLFCIGDERLTFKDRTRMFSQQYTLGRHVENHLNALERSGKLNCPHPGCKGMGVVVNNVEHLKSHAYKAHGIRLQCR